MAAKVTAAEGRLGLWLKRRGFRLEWIRRSGSDEVDFTERSVRIDIRAQPQQRVAMLLHECGHVLIWLARRSSLRKRVCGLTYKEWLTDTGPARKRTTTARLATLHEEVEAWERGRALGARLRVRENRAVSEKMRATCLMTYVRWASARN